MVTTYLYYSKNTITNWSFLFLKSALQIKFASCGQITLCRFFIVVALGGLSEFATQNFNVRQKTDYISKCNRHVSVFPFKN